MYKKMYFYLRKKLDSMYNRIGLKKKNIPLITIAKEYKKVFNWTQDAMFLIEVKDNNIFIYLRNNKRHEVLTGISYDGIRGKTPQELVGEALGNKLASNYKKCVEEGKPYSYEQTIFFPEGERVWYTTLTPIKKGRKVLYLVGSTQDITERKTLEKALFLEKEHFRITLQSLGEGVIATDIEGKILIFNKKAESLTGWLEKETLGKPIEKILRILTEKGENLKSIDTSIETTLEEVHMVSKMGTKKHIALNISPIKECDSTNKGVVFVIRDISEEKEQQKRIEYLSYHDGLTGLYNRRFFEEKLKVLDVEEQLPLSIIMADVNGLKLTNDVFGHLEGDQLLIDAADLIRENCREDQDIISRWGGDEYIVLLPRTPVKEAEEICSRLRNASESTERNKRVISISFGTCSKVKVEEDIMQVLRTAEDYMYKQKLSTSKIHKERIIESIVNQFYTKNQDELNHSKNISELCEKLGSYMKLTVDEKNKLEILSKVHDIGKIAISRDLLNKKEALTKDEWEEIMRHAETGYHIARASSELEEIAEYILCHHERYNGTGYPRKLKGKEIPLLSRIIAVVDAYETMTHDRPYRKALSEKEAIQELVMNAGSQFDPEVIEAFLNMLEQEKSANWI